MNSKRTLIGLSLAAVIGASVLGLCYAAVEAPPATAPGLVDTYSELATVLLASKKTEASVVRTICNDAYDQAMLELHESALALGAGNREAAAAHAERAATAVSMIATEGDKAVAAVRNRLLEGGHHHHAKAEIAEKYDPGYVIIDKEDKKKLLAEAGSIGRLAQSMRGEGASADALADAARRLPGIFREAVR